jgi:hypothetical protein
MQGNLDLGVTSVGITFGTSGTDINASGSPVTSSGNITINLPTASATNRGALSSADWSTFNSKQGAITLTTTGTSGVSTLVGNTLNIPNYSTDLSGYVTLGTAQTITAQKTFTTSGSSDTMIISHGSGSGFALDVIKAGSGEAIRVQKTSGSGNAMTISGGNFEAPTIVKTGGTSSQFLKADGSVDSTVYYPNSNPSGFTSNVGTVTSVGLSSATSGVTIGSTPVTSSGTITLAIATASGSQNGLLSSTDWTTFDNKTSNLGTVTSVAATAGTGISISGSPITSSGTLTITNTAPDQVVSLTASTGISVSGTYPNFTITNTSPSSGGTVTSVSASSPLFSSGGNTPNITIQQASGSQNGFLSSTDWTTFNNKTSNVGTVTSVSGTGTVSGLTLSGTVTSSGNLTLGGTLSLTSGNVTDALGFTPYNATNPAGYITSSALSAYLPLAGGTLTGALNGTSATFSNTLSVANNASNQQVIIEANRGTGAGNTCIFEMRNTNATSNKVQVSFGGGTVASGYGRTFSFGVDIGGVGVKDFFVYNGNTSNTPFIITPNDRVIIGNTGISYSDLGYKLDVLGTARVTGAATFSSSVTASQFIASSSSIAAQITSTGTTGFAVTAVGSAGGARDILLAGQSGFSNGFTVQYTGTEMKYGFQNGNVLIGSSSDNGQKLQVSGGASTALRLDANSGVAALNIGAGATISVDAPGVGGGRFLINSTGNVGIGTASPVDALVVSGENKLISFEPAGDASFCGIRWSKNVAGGNVTAASIIGTTEGNFGRRGIAFSTGNFANFTDNAVERMRITAVGNVLIGTTTDNGQKLQISGETFLSGRTGINSSPVSGVVLSIKTENNGSADFGLVIRNSSDSNLFQVRNDGSVILSSLGTGLVYSNGGILTSTNPSDFKLKKNISPINYGLAEILQLNPVTFDWKNDKIKQGKQYGFIAQEVQKIMPDLVKEGDYLGLDKEGIFTTLVKAIQELKQEIDTLKKSIQ